MPISESQLQTWANQGAVTTAKQTHESVRYALDSSTWPQGVSYDIYLQGSYKNDTNIRGDSDVDIVVELTSAFWSNLTENEKESLGLTPASYQWEEFRRDVLARLISYYGSAQVSEGNRALKLAPSAGRLPADIVVCGRYRWYSNLVPTADGIILWARDSGRELVTYPKIHSEKCSHKNSQTNTCFKPAVRMFKNARTYLVDRGVIDDKLAPSYFLECFIYNAPDGSFRSNFQSCYCDVLNWLREADYNSIRFPSYTASLFGNDDYQWSVEKAKKLLNLLVQLWNNS
jgi:hypothetical protein